MTLAAAPADGSDLRVSVEEPRRRVDPRRRDLAITVDELEVARRVRLRLQDARTSVARARCGEGLAQIECMHLHAECGRHVDGTVGRAGIDVDHVRRLGRHGHDTAAQPLAFVAAYDDDTDAGGFRVHRDASIARARSITRSYSAIEYFATLRAEWFSIT